MKSIARVKNFDVDFFSSSRQFHSQLKLIKIKAREEEEEEEVESARRWFSYFADEFPQLAL